MTTPLVAITTPAQPPTAGDRVQGFLVAIAVAVVGAVLTPFLAIAWVAIQPVLPVVAVLRARSIDRTGGGPARMAHRTAA